MKREAWTFLLTMALCSGTIVACGPKPPPPTAASLASPAPRATLPPTVLLTPTPTLSPTPSPTPDIASVMATSLALKESKQYDADVALWDRYLAFDPDYVEGYFQRATSLNWGAPDPGPLDEYIADNLAALVDLDRAITQGQAVDGRYFWRRYQALTALAGVETTRAGREALIQIASPNLVAANSVGPWSDVSKGMELADLAYLGRCKEAIPAGKRFLAEVETLYPSEPWAHARAHAHLGAGYSCAGRWADAVEQYSQALELDPDVDHWQWEHWRAVNVYFLGQLDEARQYLDQSIGEKPYYGGPRYFLRALIRYDQGMPDEAYEDLLFGRQQIWLPDGLYYLVLGRLVIDDGELAEGLDLLRQAETSLDRQYAPLMPRLQREIRQVEAAMARSGDEPIPFVTAQPDFAALVSSTPMPTLTPSPTPRYPFEIAALCPCDARIFDLSQGTGPLLIRSDAELKNYFVYVYRFQPPIRIADGSAVDLTYRILPFGEIPEQYPPLLIEFYSPESQPIPGTARWGDNRVHDLSSVGRGGEVTMVVRNSGILPVYLQNLGVRLVSSKPNGSYLIQEPTDVPFLLQEPVPPPNVTIGLEGSSGPMSVPAGNGPVIRFSPEEPLNYAQVTELTVLAEAASVTQSLPLSVVPWSPWSGGWLSSEQVSPGVFGIQGASEAVDLSGNVILALMNQGTEELDLANLSIRMVYLDQKGTEHVVGVSP